MNGKPTPRQLQAGGQLNPSRHIYITRQDVEDEVFDLLSACEYCNILSSRQVGKSSLMAHVGLRLRDAGLRVAAVDIAGDLGSPETAAEWYQGLLGRIVSRLRMDINVRQWWEQAQGVTANEKLIEFFGQELFRIEDTPVVVFIDEIDRTLELPYTDDFFTAIRTMYNHRDIEPNHEKIAFCLVGVASPNELVKERRTTAYNVGTTVELRDFDSEQDDLSQLADAMSRSGHDGRELLEAVLRWTNGHPYLTQLMCQEILKRELTTAEQVDALAEADYANYGKVSSNPHFQQITRFLDKRATDQLKTLRLYEQVAEGQDIRDDATRQVIELKLSGIVKRDPQGQLAVRNRIYERVFDLGWVRGTKPQRTVRYLKWFSTAAAAVILGLGAWLGYDQFVLKPERLAAAHWESELNETLDVEKAQKFFAVLAGNKEAPTLGRRLTGYEQQAKVALERFWVRKEKVVGGELLASLRETVDVVEAEHLRRILAGEVDEPELGRRIRGFESEVVEEFTRFEGRRDQLVAANRLLALNETSDEARAKALFATLTGQEVEPELGRTLKGFESQAVEAYRAFWERRAAKLEKTAHARLEANRLDEGLILATAAAVKAARPVSLPFRKAFEAQGYGRLYRTMRSKNTYGGWSEVAFSPRGDLIADGVENVWEVVTGRQIQQLDDRLGIGVAFSPDQKWLATTYLDVVYLWDTHTWLNTVQLTGFKAPEIHEVIFSRDGSHLAGVAAPGEVVVWSSGSWEEVGRLEDVGNWALGMAFMADNDQIVTASNDGVTSWNIASGEKLIRFHTLISWGVAVSLDGTKVAATLNKSGNKSGVAIFDIQSGTQITRFQTESHNRAVDFSPDAAYVLVASDSNTGIWDVMQGEQVLLITAHGQQVTVHDARFSSDGRLAATLGEDNTIRVWDTTDLDQPSRSFPEGSPQEVWKHMQQVLNLTLDENDEVVPLWPGGLRELDGWDPSLVEQFPKPAGDS